ncbi:MAG: tRNA lysidine(34) synthetase TilS [Oscillospiraceae bacterium]|nr:tRNA lysidine(34) synthetase TilS [Oscillospiraceae bacterium]
MNLKAEQTILKYNLLEQHDRVVVGFSGGADSVALLHFLCCLENISVTACHVNHNLRGEESERDEIFAREFCRAHGIDCRVYSIDAAALAAQEKSSVELAARNARYEIFEKLAHELDAKIATAHTLSDSAETVIINMTRGSGLKGLCGIPPQRGKIIRPLIECSRSDIENYCRSKNLDFVTDSSNLSDDYTRNRIRHHVIPVLKQINPSFERTVNRLNNSLRQDEDFLQLEANKAFEQAFKNGGLATDHLFSLHPAICNRVFLDFLRKQGAPANEQTVYGLLELARKGSGSVQTDSEHIFSVYGGILSLNNPPKSCEVFEKPLKQGVFPLADGKIAEIILIDCKNNDFCKKDFHLPLKSLLDYDRIKNTAVIRSRRQGDRFILPNRGVSKTLKKLFNEDKIPLCERERIAVIADENDILWVEGYGASPIAAVTAETKTALGIIIKQTEMERDSHEK